MDVFLVCFISGAGFLLSFLLFFHPLQQNVTANRWFSLFVFIIGCAFIGIYMLKSETATSNNFLFKGINSLQFLLAPSFYISILYFVTPTKTFSKIDLLHFIPFLIYAFVENIWNYKEISISTFFLFAMTKNVSFLVRDILPFQTLIYVVLSFSLLKRHRKNIELISSNINLVNLDWLVHFLYIFTIIVFIWLNDAFFELPFLTEATSYIYAVSIFFLAYFSIKQKTIFAFKTKDINAISEIMQNVVSNPVGGIDSALTEKSAGIVTTGETQEILASTKGKPKLRRLSDAQIVNLSAQLSLLMESDKLFLDNDLNLPTVAEKLGITIHEASFLINETTKDNFYNFINKYRIEEAKKLLSSSKIDELNILGIAFASGFNSKTTFNTTFKKIVGVSPSQYSKEQKK